MRQTAYGIVYVETSVESIGVGHELWLSVDRDNKAVTAKVTEVIKGKSFRGVAIWTAKGLAYRGSINGGTVSLVVAQA